MATKKTPKKAVQSDKITSSVAKSDDGTVQITFSIPSQIIEKERQEAISHMAKDVKVPGFRPGKAPADLAEAKLDAGHVLEHALSHILPQAFSDSIQEHKLQPVAYPKFEVISQGEVWQIRATTAEIIEFDLGDYKKIVAQALDEPKILKPGEEKKEMTRDEKEQKALLALVDSIKVKVPQLLIEDEINSRLSQLLERIEKLGLTLEGYLASLGKNIEQLKSEYEAQTKTSIALELILNKIAEKEGIKADPAEVEKAIQAAGLENSQQDPAQQRRILESVLRRRAVLDALLGSEVSLG